MKTKCIFCSARTTAHLLFIYMFKIFYVGADINARSSSGRTPLLEAVISEQYEIARMLIEAGADLDVTDTKGSSVLHQLCFTRRPNMDFIRFVLSSMKQRYFINHVLQYRK